MQCNAAGYMEALISEPNHNCYSVYLFTRALVILRYNVEYLELHIN